MDENKKELSAEELENNNTENLENQPKTLEETAETQPVEEISETPITEEVSAEEIAAEPTAAEPTAAEQPEPIKAEIETTVETPIYATPKPKSKTGVIIGAVVAGVVLCAAGFFMLNGGSSPEKVVETALNNQITLSKNLRTKMEKDIPFLNTAMPDKDFEVNMNMQPISVYGDPSLESVNALLPMFSLDIAVKADATNEAVALNYGINMAGTPLVSAEILTNSEKAVFGLPKLMKDYLSIDYNTIEEDMKASPLFAENMAYQDLNEIATLAKFYQEYPKMLVNAGTITTEEMYKDMDKISEIINTGILAKGEIAKGEKVEKGTEYIVTLTEEATDEIVADVVSFIMKESVYANFIESYKAMLAPIYGATGTDLAQIEQNLKELFRLSDTKYTMIIKDKNLVASKLEAVLGDEVNLVVDSQTNGNNGNIIATIKPQDAEDTMVMTFNMDSTIDGKMYASNIGVKMEDTAYPMNTMTMAMSIVMDGGKTEDNYVTTMNVSSADGISIIMDMPLTYTVDGKTTTMTSDAIDFSMESYGEEIGFVLGLEAVTKPLEAPITMPESKNVFKMTMEELDAVSLEVQDAFYRILMMTMGMGMGI